MNNFTFETIYVDKKIKEHPLAKNILKQCSCQTVEYISDLKQPALTKSGKRKNKTLIKKGISLHKRLPPLLIKILRKSINLLLGHKSRTGYMAGDPNEIGSETQKKEEKNELPFL